MPKIRGAPKPEPFITSLNHWHAVREGNEYASGPDTCELHVTLYAQDCRGCPISEKTGEKYCKGTPYHELVQHWVENHAAYLGSDIRPACPVCARYIDEEITFLQQLLGELIPTALSDLFAYENPAAPQDSLVGGGSPIQFYHYRRYDRKGRPVLCVCLIKADGPPCYTVYSRGMAVCSPVDYGNLRNKTGHQLAQERALRAWRTRRSDAEINTIGGRSHVIHQLIEADGAESAMASRWYKSAYDTRLTRAELDSIRKTGAKNQSAVQYSPAQEEQYYDTCLLSR